jgi:hypothetical protein
MFAFLFAAISSRADDCGFPPQQLLEKPRNEYHNRYVNWEYEYSVAIPGNLTGYDQADGPHHGFGIILGQKDQSYIDVNGEANSLEFHDPSDAAIQELKFLRDDGKKIEFSSISPSHLGKYPAVQLMARYKCPGSGLLYVHVSIFAIGSTSHVYRVSLNSHIDRYRQDRVVFDNIVNSWRYILRKDEPSSSFLEFRTRHWEASLRSPGC